MQKPLLLLSILLTLSAFFGASLANAEDPAEMQIVKPWSSKSVLADPEWQKRFLGSYGFLSGAEPDIQQAELEQLREVLETMKVNPKVAAMSLEGQMGPNSSAALDFILANLHFQSGETEKAATAYDNALSKFPDFRRAHKNLGLLRVQTNQCRHALEHLSRAVELGDHDGRNFGLMGYCYLDQGNFLSAEAAYRNAVLQQPATRDWQLGLAQALLGMEKHREAISLFDSLIEANADDDQAWMLQANAHLGVDEPLAAAVNLEAVRMMGKARQSTLALLGDIYLNEGLTDLAKNAYVELIRRDKTGGQLSSGLRAAQLMVQVESFGEASEIISALRSRYGKTLSNDNELDLLTVEAQLARAQGRSKEAAKILEHIVSRDGTRGDAILELAKYNRDLGNDQKAALLFERAASLEKFEYSALIEYAQFRVSTREYAKASSLLKQALRIRQEPRIERFLARVEDAARR
jgi:tetratricopeptide (TPR) repeat protein